MIENANNSSFTTPLPTNPELVPFRTEIESVLGPVRLMAPHNDYLTLETGSLTASDVIQDDLLNVVELYDFPADYKTDHLVKCL
jgi:hypothetical protein